MTYYVPVAGGILFAFNTKAGRDAYVARTHKVTEITRSLLALINEPKALPPADFDPFLGFMVAETRETA